MPARWICGSTWSRNESLFTRGIRFHSLYVWKRFDLNGAGHSIPRPHSVFLLPGLRFFTHQTGGTQLRAPFFSSEIWYNSRKAAIIQDFFLIYHNVALHLWYIAAKRLLYRIFPLAYHIDTAADTPMKQVVNISFFIPQANRTTLAQLHHHSHVQI